MKFLLQTIDGKIDDLDVFNAFDMIRSNKCMSEYKLADIENIGKEDYSSYIPIGSLEFVGKWLKEYKGVENMTPIEVPIKLRKPKYLGRNYEIKPLSEIELSGYKFLKRADKLKNFAYLGSLENIKNLEDGLYVISDYVELKAEYRVFVDDFNIEAIQYYDGDCTVFPDIKRLREMVGVYFMETNRPKSYTMDVAVTKDDETIIIEVHPVTSVGTYGYSGYTLLKMYKDGIDFYCK